MDANIAEQNDCMARTLAAGVKKIVLAGVDREAVELIADFCIRHEGKAFAAIGLHPTDVFGNYLEELEFMESVLERANGVSARINSALAKTTNSTLSADATLSTDSTLCKNGATTKSSRYVAIGETGIDLYHDKTFFKEQQEAFRRQISWAKEYNLPLIFHVRDAFEQTMEVLKPLQDGSLRGVFHCYSGNVEQAKQVVDMGFHLGIGGVLTFKNAGALPEVVKQIPLQWLLLETDAPFLAPVPYRGKRNESSYLPLIGYKMAEILQRRAEEVANITSSNAEKLFGI
jgi:TatD DNase family protein